MATTFPALAEESIIHLFILISICAKWNAEKVSAPVKSSMFTAVLCIMVNEASFKNTDEKISFSGC